MMLSDIDKKILELLKKADVTWPTANSHCYKLKSLGLIKNKSEESKFGLREKIVWWIK
jgi:hypothetical protein